jgi:alpha-D-xyloside xylohydrolase
MYQVTQNATSCEFNDGEKRLRIAFVNTEIVRISYIEGASFPDLQNHLVTATADFDGFRLAQVGDNFVITTDALKLCISKASGAIRFMDTSGRVLQQEPPGGGKWLTRKEVFRNVYDNSIAIEAGQNIDGARADAEPIERVFERHAFEAKLEFTFTEGEALFGLGSHEEGNGNLRGKSQDLYQQNMKSVVPCFVSSKGYGIVMDCSSLMVFHDDSDGSYMWADVVDQLDYYFIGGGDASAIARNYYQLTGAPPMLPRWAFGYVQSKERYVNAEEILSVAKEYRRREIPLDVMVLDWKSWPDGHGWGQKSFDPVRFPTPQALIAELHAMDVKLMTSIWPIMTGDCPNQVELFERGLMLGNQSTYNAFDPEGRTTYWKQAHDGLFAEGVDAWWCDCTEPFEADWEGAVKPEPLQRMKVNTGQAKRYIDEGQILAYSLFHSQGMYEGQRDASNKKRVLNLTRSSHVGQHRYATVSWSGDICGTWEVLRRSIPEGVNFCATGEPYWTVDIGGFFVDNDPDRWFWSGDYSAGCRGLGPMEGTEPIANDNGCTDLGYWELYTRWLQYGCFLPMFRSHGTDAAREIWRFGDVGNRFYDTIAAFIRLRYRLLPYIYSVAAGVADSGMALLRPVAMQYPQDRGTLDLADQYLFGPGLMVCPVTQPMYYGKHSQPLEGQPETRPVYLPSGIDWYDFWSDAVHLGGTTIEAAAPLERIPLFIPAGSIIPMGPVTQHAGVAAEGPLELHLYTGADASFVWYEDSGDGYGYEAGESARVTISWNEPTQTLSVSERTGQFEGMAQTRILNITLHTPEGLREMSVCYKGSALKIV